MKLCQMYVTPTATELVTVPAKDDYISTDSGDIKVLIKGHFILGNGVKYICDLEDENYKKMWFYSWGADYKDSFHKGTYANVLLYSHHFRDVDAVYFSSKAYKTLVDYYNLITSERFYRFARNNNNQMHRNKTWTDLNPCDSRTLDYFHSGGTLFMDDNGGMFSF